MTDNPHTAFIALGANLGKPLKQCQQAVEKIQQISQSELMGVSSFYRSEPLVSPHEDASIVPQYINAVCKIKTRLSAQTLLDQLLSIEKQMGRTLRKKWESRVIDLDLLFFDALVCETPTLTLPHPEIQNRNFVLEPFKEIAPEWVHPKLGESIQALAKGLKSSSKIERI